MGVFDEELVLPGTITEIMSDYNYGYDSSLFGTTDSVTVIGTAFNGPVGKPVPVYSPEHARYMFGGTYDSETRREASLVAEIQDAYDRGCRTIYAVRVSGKDIYKDFQLALESNLKLRLSGIFPSNANKNVYMTYDNTVGASSIKVFKPSSRATIEEKSLGLVESDESILVIDLDLSNSYGITKDSRLVDLIKLVNEYAYNNVLRLSIVDENGNDVTISSTEAQALSVGAVFPGAYFIGRDSNKCIATTDSHYVFVDDAGSNKPYSNFSDKIFKELTLNSDIVADMPIYGTLDALNSKFAGLVSMTKMFDFLAIPGKVDLVFGKDTVDYEEVELANFDLYKKLGSGFATTAKAEFKNAANPALGVKIIETPVSDTNRIKPIKDGIYSMLENLTSDYRVLTIGTADTAITGKIPKKADFTVASDKTATIFDGYVDVVAKVDSADLTEPKSYKFSLESVAGTYGDATTIKPALFTSKIIKRVASAADLAALKDTLGNVKKYKNGTLFLVGTAPAFTLYRYNNGVLTAITDSAKNADLNGTLFMVGNIGYKVDTSAATIAYTEVAGTEFGTKTYVLVQSDFSVSVYAVVSDTKTTFEPVGGIGEIFNNNEDKTLITVQNEYCATNGIYVKSAVLDYTTLEEFVEILNNDENLGRLFKFTVNNNVVGKKDDYVLDLDNPKVSLAVLGGNVIDKVIGFDMNLYIPYKTTDNFARQLAQHCTYTSLKTAPTHGVIGCKKLLDVNLNNISNNVDSLVDLDLNLYAKKDNGRNMLDRNNMPYGIGKNISVTAEQYSVALDEGYTYISNGAAGYAGMVSKLSLDQSSTLQSISIPTPAYEYTNYQLSKLKKKGFITFKNSYTKGYVVTDGTTMAEATSKFKRLSTTRILNATEKVIRAATEPFIGKQNNLANRNSMQTAIKSGIDKMVDKYIQKYDFKLIIDKDAANLGIIDIDYTIYPINEIVQVGNRITVKDSE